MKVILKLLLANLKMTVRNRQALFWSIVFPLIFIGIFGLFDMEKGGSVKVGFSDQANTTVSQTITDSLKKIPAFNVIEANKSEEEIKQDVKNGNLAYGIIIPETFKNLQNPEIKSSEPPSLKVYYDAKNVQNNSVILGTLKQFVTQTNMMLAQTPTLLTMSEEPVEAKKITYIEFIMTGMLGMSVMQFGIIRISISLSNQRETNILKKLLTTPLRLRDYVIAFIINDLILGLTQASIILLASHFFFKANIYGSLFLLYLMIMLGTLVFLCLGFVVAGIAKTTQAAAGLAQLFTTPMMFLSGVFFSTELLPPFMQKVVQFLPLSPLLTALRKIGLDGAGLAEVKTPIIYLVIWLIVAFLLAISIFRFTENKD